MQSGEAAAASRATAIPWFVAAVFLLVYLVTAQVGTLGPFSSPDETANRFFAERVARTGVPDAPADPASSLVRPRSVGQRGDRLVPNTFLGLPLLYGAVGRALGLNAMGYIAPVLAVLAALALQRLVRPLFGFSVSVVAMVLLLVHPTYWYYSVHGFWHNGPFVSFLLLGAYLLYRARRGWWLASLAGGLAIGIAAAIRTSELPWIAAGLIVVAALSARKLRWGHAAFVAGFTLVALLVARSQQYVFGSSLLGAYAPVIADAAESMGPGAGWWGRILGVLAPTGWDLGRTAEVFVRYSGVLMFGSFALGLLGAFPLLRPSAPRTLRWYAVGFWALSLWLVLYYGSFSFVEFRPEPDAALLGSSYLRYWLPLYVAAVPLAARFLLGLRGAIRSVVLAGVVVTSLLQFTVDPYAGYSAQLGNRSQAVRSQRDIVLAATPDNAVVLAGPLDKVLWPGRRVVGFDSEPLPDAVLRSLGTLSDASPVFFIPAVPGDAERVAARIADVGLYLEPVVESPDGFSLLGVRRRGGS